MARKKASGTKSGSGKKAANERIPKKGAKKASTTKAATTKAAAKGGGSQSGVTSASATKKAVVVHKLLFANFDAVTFTAVCQVDGAVGASHASRSDATDDAIAHEEATGHIVKVIQTQSVG